MSRNLRLVIASLLAALTAVSAYLIIPIGPVPITMQTCFVLLSGAVLGSRWGAGSQIVYISLGLIGLPVFTNGFIGPGVFLHQPSATFLALYQRRSLQVYIWNIFVEMESFKLWLGCS